MNTKMYNKRYMNKRFVGQRYPSLGGRSQGVCKKFGQAHPFRRHMVLDAGVLAKLKRQTKQRRRRYGASTYSYHKYTKHQIPKCIFQQYQ
jgi:hypothetical protein